MLDEFIHHGAEVGVLRDLWRWQHPLGEDDLAEQAMRGDMALVDALSDHDLAGRQDLVEKAAEYARWELLIALVERGAPLPESGRTPLHLAAGAGELSVVQALLDRGANPAATDPTFGATPAQWARFFHQSEVAALLGEG
jgi:ankyrin repeat protein